MRGHVASAAGLAGDRVAEIAVRAGGKAPGGGATSGQSCTAHPGEGRGPGQVSGDIRANGPDRAAVLSWVPAFAGMCGMGEAHRIAPLAWAAASRAALRARFRAARAIRASEISAGRGGAT